MKGNPSARLGHPIPPDPRILALPGALARTALLPLCLQHRGVCFLNDSQLETLSLPGTFPLARGMHHTGGCNGLRCHCVRGNGARQNPTLAAPLGPRQSKQAGKQRILRAARCGAVLSPCPTENPASPWGPASPARGSGRSGEFAAPAGNEAGARLGVSAGSR